MDARVTRIWGQGHLKGGAVGGRAETSGMGEEVLQVSWGQHPTRIQLSRNSCSEGGGTGQQQVMKALTAECGKEPVVGRTGPGEERKGHLERLWRKMYGESIRQRF